MKNDKDKINYKNLNEVISLSKEILKVFFVTMIVLIIIGVILIFRELNIFSFILKILGVIAPFFIGLLIAWILDPMVTYLQKKNVKRIIGTIVVFCGFTIILYILFRLIIPMLYTQINDFVSMIPSLLLEIKNFISGVIDKLSTGGIDLSNIETNIYKSLETLGTNLTTTLPTNMFNFASNFVSSIGTFFIGLLVGFYLLVDFDSIKHLLDIIPKKYHKDIITLAVKLNDAFKKFIQGTLLISLAIMIISAIGYGLVGLPSPLLFGLICGITNIIPYIGPWIGGAICVIVGFTVSPMVGILSGVIAFAVQQIDSVILQPLIMGKTMKLHPVTIMIGLLVFGYFFGIIGMIFATPIIAGLKIIINHIDEKYEIMDKIKQK
ncbi:MAG: AI-2E family transporter [bacterium]|nr:AI-2E family transporter [bacterium]